MYICVCIYMSIYMYIYKYILRLGQAFKCIPHGTCLNVLAPSTHLRVALSVWDPRPGLSG